MHMQMSLIIPIDFTLNFLVPLISQDFSFLKASVDISCFPYYLH